MVNFEAEFDGQGFFHCPTLMLICSLFSFHYQALNSLSLFIYILFVFSFVSSLALLTADGQGILVSGGGVRKIQKDKRKFGQIIGEDIISVTFIACKCSFRFLFRN